MNNKIEIVTLPNNQKMDVTSHPAEVTAARINWEKAHSWALYSEDQFRQGGESMSGVTKTRAKCKLAEAEFWKLMNLHQISSEPPPVPEVSIS